MRSRLASSFPRFATYLWAIVAILSLQIISIRASPMTIAQRDSNELEKRTHFPDYPPSCQICEPHFSSISTCANGSVIFSDVQEVLVSPLSFVSEITCACSSTFQYYYPQCVDCFEQTNQTAFLEPSNGNYSTIIQGLQQVCALASVLFGGVAAANSELPGQTPITVASGAAVHRHGVPLLGISGQGTIPLLMGLSTILMGFAMGVWTVL